MSSPTSHQPAFTPDRTNPARPNSSFAANLTLSDSFDRITPPTRSLNHARHSAEEMEEKINDNKIRQSASFAALERCFLASREKIQPLSMRAAAESRHGRGGQQAGSFVVAEHE